MKIYRNFERAMDAEKEVLLTPKCCPFGASSEGSLCGGWCPHFHTTKDIDGKIAGAMLTCGGQDCRIKVEEE